MHMPNATQLIRQDHKKVEGLFKKFEQTKGGKAKRRIADNAMAELEVHAMLEEEIFYPAVEKEIDDGSMVKEALEEHQTVKDLIAELKEMEEEDEEFESKFSELMENVQHHVEEEESEMLPKVEEDGLDLKDLGEQMSERKRELQGGGSRSAKRAKSKTPRKTAAKSKSSGRKKSGSKRASGGRSR